MGEEVSLYRWPPVWLVWNHLHDNWQFCFYLQNRLIQTSQTGGHWYSDNSTFSIPWWNISRHRDPLLKEKISTADHLVLSSSDQQLFTLKIDFSVL
jgi:hypothetical protein